MKKLKQIVRSTLRAAGYEIRPVHNRYENSGYVQYRYLDNQGAFDYKQYRRIQEDGNKRKLDWVAVLEPNIEFLSNYIIARMPDPKFGICHGTRRGKEQEWFRKYLGCKVIGTEISETATQFPHTIQWDFHEVKPEWLDAVDFIYSNSFDHTYDPEKCLSAWMSCLKKGGLCLLEYSSANEPLGANMLDPFGADLPLMPYLITLWGRGSFGVREILDAPVKSEGVARLNFVVVQKF